MVCLKNRTLIRTSCELGLTFSFVVELSNLSLLTSCSVTHSVLTLSQSLMPSHETFSLTKTHSLTQERRLTKNVVVWVEHSARGGLVS